MYLQVVIYLQVVLRSSTGHEYPYITNKAVDPTRPPTGGKQNNKFEDNNWNYFRTSSAAFPWLYKPGLLRCLNSVFLLQLEVGGFYGDIWNTLQYKTNFSYTMVRLFI